jgi:PKHD-type hydroxylase
MKYFWYTYKDFFSKKELKELNDVLLNSKDNDKYDRPSLLENKIKECDVSISSYSSAKHILYKIDEVMKHINTTVFGFDIYPLNDFQDVFLNQYYSSNKGYYNFHYDGEPHTEVFTSKITVLINTSEEKYTGGEFCIFDGREIVIEEFNEPGTVLLFPSFLYHAVKPVTKGARSTVAIWCRGPHWR